MSTLPGFALRRRKTGLHGKALRAPSLTKLTLGGRDTQPALLLPFNLCLQQATQLLDRVQPTLKEAKRSENRLSVLHVLPGQESAECAGLAQSLRRVVVRA